MQSRRFGRTGLPVSELALGALPFGWRVDEPSARAVLEAYGEAGGNFIQTVACARPGDAGDHRSEEIVGRWLRTQPGRRERLVLATRLAFPRTSAGQSAVGIRHATEESLRRLGVSHLDLLVLDWSPAALPFDEVFRVLDELMRAGKLRYVGAAGFPLWRLMEALGRSMRLGTCRFESLQADFSLADRGSFEPEGFQLAREQRLALLAQSPLAGGFLTGLYGSPALDSVARARRLRERYGQERGSALLDALQAVATETEATCAQVALAWILARDAPVIPLLGVATPEQLREAAGAVSLRLEPSQLARLDGVDPSQTETSARSTCP